MFILIYKVNSSFINFSLKVFFDALNQTQKIHSEENFKQVPNLIFKINVGVPLSILFAKKLLKIALMSTHFFYLFKRRIYLINRDLQIASFYIKNIKNKMNIGSEGPFTPFPP